MRNSIAKAYLTQLNYLVQYNPVNYNEHKYGILTAVIRYKLPDHIYDSSGPTIAEISTLAFAIGHNVAVDLFWELLT